MKEKDLHASVAEFLDWALLPPALYTTFPAGWGELPKATAGRLKGCGLKKGMPDILVFYGHAYGIELKSPGGKPTVAQQAMFHQLREAGVQVFICESIEEVAWRLHELDIPLRRMTLWHEGGPREHRRLPPGATSAKPAASGEAGGANGPETL